MARSLCAASKPGVHKYSIAWLQQAGRDSPLGFLVNLLQAFSLPWPNGFCCGRELFVFEGAVAADANPVSMEACVQCHGRKLYGM